MSSETARPQGFLPVIERETLPDGTVLLQVPRCAYSFTRPRPGTLVVLVAGQETGELGRAPIGEVAVEAALHPPLRLFIDLSGLTLVAPAVSDGWTAWFRANQESLAKIDVLVASAYVHLTVAVSKLFSRTGNLMRIHTDPAAFAAVVHEASVAAAND